MTATDAPIFILGANRSGTTLLRLILNAHSRIAIPDEVGYFEKIHQRLTSSWRPPDLSTGYYAQFVDRVIDRDFEHLSGLDHEALKARIVATTPRDYRQPYMMALAAWARAQGKARWGEKTPANLFYVDVLIDMFPTAQFIYLARDPRDGVRSMQETEIFPDDVVFNALSRRKHAREALRLLPRHVPPDQWTTVRYEDLVTDPESVTRSLCAFLGETYEPSMLAYHRDAERYLNDEAARTYNATATRPITTARLGMWKEKLDHAAVATVELICRPEMKWFDYPPSGKRLPPNRWPSLLFRLWYWALQCWRNRDVPHYTIKHPPFARFRSDHLQPVRAALKRMQRKLSH